MERPLVSVLMPFKNTSLYLKACLDSIQNQSYAHWELIMVNDHSTDDSVLIAQSYASKDKRISVHDNNGSGIIEALRLAYKRSKGSYITRMDSDDIMHAHKLQVMVNDLRTNGSGHIALGLVRYFSEENVSEGYQRYEDWLNALTRTGRNFTEVYKECVIPSPCWMLHRSDLDLCGAFNHDHYPEDYDLVFRMYQNGLTCIPSNQLLHHWRDYNARTSKTSTNYAIEAFTTLKIRYFIQIDRDDNRPLTIWGAGEKAKIIAKYLIHKNIDFQWLTANPNKVQKKIYGKELITIDAFEQIINPQCIISIANAQAQAQIEQYMQHKNWVQGVDFYFFC